LKWLFKFGHLESEAGEQLFGANADAVAVNFIELAVKAGNSMPIVCILGLGQLRFDLPIPLIAIYDVVDRRTRRAFRLLLHPRTAQTFRHQQIASVQTNLAGQAGKQAGFAGAIATNDAGLLAFIDGQGRAFQQHVFTAHQARVCQIDHDWRSSLREKKRIIRGCG